MGGVKFIAKLNVYYECIKIRIVIVLEKLKYF